MIISVFLQAIGKRCDANKKIAHEIRKTHLKNIYPYVKKRKKTRLTTLHTHLMNETAPEQQNMIQ